MRKVSYRLQLEVWKVQKTQQQLKLWLEEIGRDLHRNVVPTQPPEDLLLI
jgi:hypothetical protein